jgi:neutral ceramidase
VGSKPEFTRCRRKLMKPGTIGPNPFGETGDQVKMHGGDGPNVIRPTGLVDPQVGVLSLQHADGRPLGVLASYSIHYVTGDKRGDVTADYFGHFADRLATLMKADKSNPPFVGMMANSNSGDTGGPGGGYKAQEQVGNALAEEVLRVCRQIDYHDRVPLAACQSAIELGVRLPDAKRIEWAKAVLAGTWKGKGLRNSKVYAQQTLELAEFPAAVPVFLQAFRIGELGITTNPCEMYASTALAIRKSAPLHPCFNIELANGYRGYLPPPEQHKLGGYTTWPATSSCLEVDAEPKVRQELLRLLREVATDP